jgi:uncharacterized protein YndB with AHSA1/START domain
MPEQATAVAPVVKTITVPVPVDRAFAVFTQEASSWWPQQHVIVAGGRESMVFEPGVGGRWYERSADGRERDWGRILAWEQPYRLAMTWRIDGRWQPIDDDEHASEITVTFRELGPRLTEVEAVHHELDRLGEAATGMRAALDRPGPGATLAGFAAAF